MIFCAEATMYGALEVYSKSSLGAYLSAHPRWARAQGWEYEGINVGNLFFLVEMFPIWFMLICVFMMILQWFSLIWFREMWSMPYVGHLRRIRVAVTQWRRVERPSCEFWRNLHLAERKSNKAGVNEPENQGKLKLMFSTVCSNPF